MTPLGHKQTLDFNATERLLWEE